MYILEKKLIFTHPPKCGGTSIEFLFNFPTLIAESRNERHIKHASLEQHIQILKNKNVSLDDFFKFSIIRNPWERAVSFYNDCKYRAYAFYEKQLFNKKINEIPEHIQDARKLSFKEFVDRRIMINDWISDQQTLPFMLNEKKFALDYVIRFENLKEELFSLQNILQLDLSSVEIPHVHSSDLFVQRKPYQEYYDDKTKNLITKHFEWDIDTFKYTFD